MKNIKAFGKLVSREKAYEIIINDKICEIVYAEMTDTLEDMMMFGFDSLEEWSDQELEDYINDLCIENQPNGRI